MNHPSNPDLWKKHAGAFIVRARAQLWGKHNETALSWLYEKGFSVKYAQAMLFGYNRRYTSRRLDTWGILSKTADEKCVLPPGIVIPYIVNQTLKKITILQMDEERTMNITPDRTLCPDIALTNNKQRLVIIDDAYQGYLVHQLAGEDYDIMIPARSGCSLFKHGSHLVDSYTHIYYVPASAETISDDINADGTVLYATLPPGAAAGDIVRQLTGIN